MNTLDKKRESVFYRVSLRNWNNVEFPKLWIHEDDIDADELIDLFEFNQVIKRKSIGIKKNLFNEMKLETDDIANKYTLEDNPGENMMDF